MSGRSVKKRKRAQAKSLPETTPEGLKLAVTDGRWVQFSFYVLLGFYCVYYFSQLFGTLDNTFFWADENKLAFVSNLVADTGRFPAMLPDTLYGEFRWSYPPLFNLLGALFIKIAGADSLRFFNFSLLILSMVLFFYLIHKHYGRTTAIIACLLISLSPALAINSIRYVSDLLSMLLAFLSFFSLLIALKEMSVRYAVTAGFATTLLMLSKQTGIVILGFYVILLMWFAWKDRKVARLLLLTVAISLIGYLPYAVWIVLNQTGTFNFITVFLGLTGRPDWAAEGVASFRRYDSSIKEFAYLFYTGNGVVLSLSILLPIFHFIKIRGKDLPQFLIFLQALFLVLVIIVWHISNTRHTLVLLPLIVFLSAYALTAIFKNKALTNAILLILFIYAGYTAHRMPNYRATYNAPQEFVEMADMIRREGAPDGRVVCLYKFDTLMYTGKPALWPHPKMKTPPVDLFEKQSADDLYALLKNYRATYVLFDNQRIVQADRFRSKAYPLYFMQTCQQLYQQGKITLRAISPSKRFMLLKIL